MASSGRKCIICKREKDQNQFSKRQWNKGKAAKCKKCIEKQQNIDAQKKKSLDKTEKKESKKEKEKEEKKVEKTEEKQQDPDIFNIFSTLQRITSDVTFVVGLIEKNGVLYMTHVQVQCGDEEEALTFKQPQIDNGSRYCLFDWKLAEHYGLRFNKNDVMIMQYANDAYDVHGQAVVDIFVSDGVHRNEDELPYIFPVVATFSKTEQALLGQNFLKMAKCQILEPPTLFFEAEHIRKRIKKLKSSESALKLTRERKKDMSWKEMNQYISQNKQSIIEKWAKQNETGNEQQQSMHIECTKRNPRFVACVSPEITKEIERESINNEINKTINTSNTRNVKKIENVDNNIANII